MSGKLTITQVHDVILEVDRIAKVAHDPEQAHVLDDKLRETILEFISSGECVDLEQARAMSIEALRTNQHLKKRWCA